MIRPTLEQVKQHLDTCVDGHECKLRAAQEWAVSVAKPGHTDEVRDLMMSLHLAEIEAKEKTDHVNCLTTILGAIVRRAPGKTLSVAERELESGDETLVMEETDDGFDLSCVSDRASEGGN